MSNFPQVFAVVSECPRLNQLVPSYTISAPGGISFDASIPDRCPQDWWLNWSFRESSITMNSCVSEEWEYRWPGLWEALTSCIWGLGELDVHGGCKKVA